MSPRSGPKQTLIRSPSPEGRIGTKIGLTDYLHFGYAANCTGSDFTGYRPYVCAGRFVMRPSTTHGHVSQVKSGRCYSPGSSVPTWISLSLNNAAVLPSAMKIV